MFPRCVGTVSKAQVHTFRVEHISGANAQTAVVSGSGACQPKKRIVVLASRPTSLSFGIGGEGSWAEEVGKGGTERSKGGSSGDWRGGGAAGVKGVGKMRGKRDGVFRSWRKRRGGPTERQPEVQESSMSRFGVSTHAGWNLQGIKLFGRGEQVFNMFLRIERWGGKSRNKEINKVGADSGGTDPT